MRGILRAHKTVRWPSSLPHVVESRVSGGRDASRHLCVALLNSTRLDCQKCRASDVNTVYYCLIILVNVVSLALTSTRPERSTDPSTPPPHWLTPLAVPSQFARRSCETLASSRSLRCAEWWLEENSSLGHDDAPPALIIRLSLLLPLQLYSQIIKIFVSYSMVSGLVVRIRIEWRKVELPAANTIR